MRPPPHRPKVLVELDSRLAQRLKAHTGFADLEDVFGRPKGTSYAAALCALLLAASASAATGDASGRAASTASRLKQTHSVFFGVSIDRPSETLAGFEQTARKRVALVNSYVSLASARFDTATADAVWSRGAEPMVTWEPWRDGRLGPNQPEFSLSRFLDGRFDPLLRHFAESVRDWGHPVLLRFAPEMNGYWNSWSPGVNGNSAREFVAVWRHVHDLFAAAGARNVEWVWSPNVSFPHSTPLRVLYPGDAYVDWVGVDGYNWGKSRAGTQWASFASIFGPTLRSISRLTTKPIVLTEVGSTEVGGKKSAWIRDFLSQLGRNPSIVGFVWFQYDKETDWRIDSSSASRAAFGAGLAQRRYVGAFSLTD
jgi:beta-mannanase